VFGSKPVTYAQMTKQLHLYVNDHRLSGKQTEPKTEPKVETKNGKKTTKVNTVEEMKKEVAKLTAKKGKK
jgi:hypothetical protein